MRSHAFVQHGLMVEAGERRNRRRGIERQTIQLDREHRTEELSSRRIRDASAASGVGRRVSWRAI